MVVPEGIELRSGLGCQMFQGYFFSGPVPAIEFPETVRRIVVDLADPRLTAA